MNEETYRHQLRDLFMRQLKNSKLQPQKYRSNNLTDSQAQFNEQTFSTQQNIHELEINMQGKQRQTQNRTSGGDADRVLYEPHHSSHQANESYRQRNIGDNNYSLKQLHCNPKMAASTGCHNTPTSKYHTTPAAVDEYTNHRYFYDTDSNLGGICNGSEGSAKSQKSSKTVVSRKSSQDLRKMVKSKCKLQEVIDETLKGMCKSEMDTNVDDNTCILNEQTSTQCPLTQSHCKRCSDRVHSIQSQKDVMTEIGKSDFLECRHTDTLTISVDDVVNSKVINPMIRKLQRMYLNNLKEEMSLMEDLERLPQKVNEVYKATIFKQKD